MAAAWAMPLPMSPHPSTPTVVISLIGAMGSYSGAEGLEHFVGEEAEDARTPAGQLMLGPGRAMLEMVERPLEAELEAGSAARYRRAWHSRGRRRVTTIATGSSAPSTTRSPAPATPRRRSPRHRPPSPRAPSAPPRSARRAIGPVPSGRIVAETVSARDSMNGGWLRSAAVDRRSAAATPPTGSHTMRPGCCRCTQRSSFCSTQHEHRSAFSRGPGPPAVP